MNELYFIQREGVFRIEKNVIVHVEEVVKPLVVECDTWESPVVANCREWEKEKLKRRARTLSRLADTAAPSQADKKTE